MSAGGILSNGRFLWGKYKGEPVRDVPDEYLIYIIGSSEATIDQLQQELDRRAQVASASQSWAQRIVEAGFRTMAKQHHPDHGGSHSDMQELNAAAAALREIVRGED